MAPVDRPALYVGKLLGILMLLAVVEAILVPLVALMFQAPLFAHPVLAAGLLGDRDDGLRCGRDAVRGDAGARAQPRRAAADPVVSDHDSGDHCGVRGTAALLQPDVDLRWRRIWLAMLAFFDVVFVTLALWTFEPVMTE